MAENRQIMNRITLPLRFLVLAMACAAPVAAARAAEEPAAPVSGLKPEIRAEDLEADVRYLADDASGGRLTGTDGIDRAARYVAAAFEAAGLSPVPGLDDYFQPFSFTSGVRLTEGGSHLQIREPGGARSRFQAGKQFVPLAFSGNGEADGEVVFAGYGIVEPVDNGYDSYQGLDVTGKIVLCLRDVPEEVASERRQELALYAGDRYKAKLAADRGASGFLLVIGPSSPNGGELIRFRESSRTAAIPIPAASVTQTAADSLLGPSGKTIAELQKSLDDGTIHPHEAAPRGVPIILEVDIERVIGTCRNVLGYLPPSPGIDEIVVVGGHYDHIGTGEDLGSLARKGEEGMIHNGADDNASGTSVVLELAAFLPPALRQQSEAPHRGLLFAAWSGEELGLVGSDHFVENPPVPLDRIVAYFNFDMVGRLRDNTLIVKAVGSSSVWRGLLERRNIPAGFHLSILEDPYLPTDLTSFYTHGVPGLDFFTDLHDEYNSPRDDADTLDYAGMVRVAGFAQRLIRDAVDPDREIDYRRVQQTTAPASGMGRRVYTGMVPDFGGGSDVEGMLVSDVRPGGPAEKAGVTGGDVVVEFAGKTIGSLQDYSDALRGAKVGEAVSLVVIRDGERVVLAITPEARKP
jgi:hypothetical protein